MRRYYNASEGMSFTDIKRLAKISAEKGITLKEAYDLEHQHKEPLKDSFSGTDNFRAVLFWLISWGLISIPILLLGIYITPAFGFIGFYLFFKMFKDLVISPNRKSNADLMVEKTKDRFDSFKGWLKTAKETFISGH